MHKKNPSLRLIGLAMVILLLFSACSKSEDVIDSSIVPGISQTKYLEDKGYNIIEENGKVSSYTLEKDILLKTICWGVQTFDIQPYIGKQIDTYSYIVDNHPLDKLGDLNQTKVWLLVCENEIIGGFSLHNTTDTQYGGVYSLDGHTLEEVTGMDYQDWREEWFAKYD